MMSFQMNVREAQVHGLTLKCTFGCQILVLNHIFGGLVG